MRSVLAVVCAIAVPWTVTGCGGEDPGPVRVHLAEEAPEGAGSAFEPEGRPIASAIDVGGVLATDLDVPIAGRAITLLDTRGVRRDVISDAAGAFEFLGVTPPYDLSVEPVKGGATTIFAGLTRRDPHLELFERDGPTPSPARQTLRVGVHAPSCGGDSCVLTAASASASGAGSATTWFGSEEQGSDRSFVLDVEHGWRGSSLAAGEVITVHVLLSDVDHSSFRYARIDGVMASPGEATDLGFTPLEAMRTTAPIRMGVPVALGGGALADWAWSTQASIHTADGGAFTLSALPSASLVTRLPVIPGAVIRVDVSATHPRSGEGSGFHRSAMARSGSVAIEMLADPIALGVSSGPEMIRPVPGGTLSRRGLGFAWSDDGRSQLATLSVADTARGAVRFRVLTNEHEFALARLHELGLPKLRVGNHELHLSAAPDVGVDDVTSPDVTQRRTHANPALPAAVSHLRVPFQVTR